MKTTLRRLALALAATGLMAGAAQAQLNRVTIGTNPQGTMYYVVGGGLATLFSNELGLRASVQPHAGASVYLPLIHSGEVTMGLSSSLDSNMAFTGMGPYEGTGGLKKLRTLARAWPLPYAYVARADSGLRTMTDLKGKRVAVNFRANAALEASNRAMIAAAGLDPDTDVEAVTISGIPEGYNLVIDGSIDAAPTALGIPLLRQAHSTVPGGMIVIALDGPDATDGFLDSQLPGLYTMTARPGDNNPGVDGDTLIAGFDAFYVVSADMSDEDAYTLLKTIYESYGKLQEDYPVLRSSPPELLGRPANTVPYHDGARRFFEEAGLWTDANTARDAALLAQ